MRGIRKTNSVDLERGKRKKEGQNGAGLGSLSYTIPLLNKMRQEGMTMRSKKDVYRLRAPLTP
jgi:hypothetical protein